MPYADPLKKKQYDADYHVKNREVLLQRYAARPKEKRKAENARYHAKNRETARLCYCCNLSLGHAKDKTEVLQGLIEYLGKDR